MKHSSYTSFGSSKLIGFFIRVRSSGTDYSNGLGCIPIYSSLKVSGILPILRSKSSGWLQTFLNCMTRFIKFSILALLSTSLKRSCVEILLLILWYSNLCLCVIMTECVYSVFGPISSSMSSFSLRSIKGFKTRCRRLNWCLLISP